MPFIDVKLTKENGGLNKSQKEELAKKLTDSVVSIVGRGQKTCVVVIDEVETDNYAIGGETVTNIRAKAKG